MEMKVTYIAIDGTEFEDREECLQYESSFTAMSEFVQLYDRDFSPVEWNPENYEDMWNHIYYIVIEPHREKEVEEWWDNTFSAQLGVSPFGHLDSDWSRWLKTGHGDEPTIIAYDFNEDTDWVILNKIYSKACNTIKYLGLAGALS